MAQDRNDKQNVSGAQFTQPPEEFKVRSATTSEKFLRQNIPPPGTCYVGVDDQLFVSVLQQNNPRTVQCNLRILRDDGLIIPMTFTVAPSSAHTFTSATFNLVEGFILSLSLVLTASAGDSNPTFGSATLIRNPGGIASQHEMLAAGYISANYPVSYPSVQPVRDTDGVGYPRSQTISNPAAGVDWSFSVPASTRLRMVAASALLTTAVAVANRLPSLFLDDSVNVYAIIPSGNTQIASLAVQYTWADSCPQAAVYDNKVIAPIPSTVRMPQSHRIRTVTTNLQAADQWSAIVLLYEDQAALG